MNLGETIETKEMVELDILQQILSSAESADITSVNGIRIIEGVDGKKYNLDKIEERCSYLFDKFMKQYAI